MSLPSGLYDLVVIIDDVEHVILNEEGTILAPIAVVEAQLDQSGTTPFWQEVIAQWRQDGRVE